jgi:hypothetical protein
VPAAGEGAARRAEPLAAEDEGHSHG